MVEKVVKTLGGRLIALAAGMMAAGLILAAIAYWLAGPVAVEGVGYSLVLCLVPGVLTILLAELFKKSDMVGFAVLAGGAFRLVFVLLGLFGVTALRPDFGFRQFTVWLLANYMVALALETTIVLVPANRESVGHQS